MSQDTITRKILTQLETKIETIKHDLAQGKTLDEDSAESTLGHTARLVGKIEGINEIFKIAEE